MPFDPLNIATLRVPLNVTPTNNDDTDENAVIHRLRGKTYNNSTRRLGRNHQQAGRDHALRARDHRDQEPHRHLPQRNRPTWATLYGMLHAIDTATGTEKWAYIPRNLLGKLKNNRSDPNAVQDFAAVDASPTVRDVYFDHDNNGTKEWRTVLACAQGFGGKSIFALDVTDPNAWSVMWEATDTAAPGGGMGNAYGVAIDKVKWPVRDAQQPDHRL